MSKQLLHTKALVIKENVQDNGVIDAVIGSTAVIDRMGDIISQDGWDLSNFKENPVILWGHNVKEEKPPIGKALKVWVEDKGLKTAKLMFKVQFDLQDSFAADIFRKVKEGFINTVSVGFLPTEWIDLDPDNWFGGRKYTKQELLELSFVPVPANPEAVVSLRSFAKEDKRFTPVEEKDMFPEVKDDRDAKKEELKTQLEATIKAGRVLSGANEEKIQSAVDLLQEVLDSIDDTPMEDDEKELSKNVIAYKNLGTEPESEVWDVAGEVLKADIKTLADMSAYFDSTKANDKSSYKLVHHNSDKKAVWRGVGLSMSILMGAKGGIELTPEERKSVYEHLVEHYKEFNKVAPDYKSVEKQVLAGLEQEILVMALEREEKHEVRLIKKLLKEIKDQKKKQEPQIENIIEGLKLIDTSLNGLNVK